MAENQEDALKRDSDGLPMGQHIFEEIHDRNDSSTRRIIQSVKSKTKRRAKSILGVPDSSDREDDAESTLQAVSKDPAFNPTLVERELNIKHAKAVGGPVKQVVAAVDVTAAALAHPRKTAVNKLKRKAAHKISGSARGPYPLQGTDLSYLEHDREEHDRNSSSSTSSIRNLTSHAHRKNLENIAARNRLLEGHHDAMQVAWITTRIRRVRVVPKATIAFPSRASFEQRDENNNLVKVDWLNWVGEIFLYLSQNFSNHYIDDFEELPFDLNIFRDHIERLILVSASWQTYIMSLRSLYRWEDPKRTFTYLALYFVFWYTNYVMTYFWGWIIYKVVARKFCPSPAEDLRAAANRAVNHKTVAFQLGEIIERHGREEWIDPFLNEVGPFAQVQVNDLANLLEVVWNFANWKYPYLTFSSLVFFGSCLLTAVFTSTEYSMKIVWFILGGAFFFCWPIASLYPRYRLLVSPLKWVFWSIPTHAEWSFYYLHQKSQMARQAMVRKKGAEQDKDAIHEALSRKDVSNHEISGSLYQSIDKASEYQAESSDEHYESASSTFSQLSGTDIVSFRASWNGMNGRVVIFSQGVRFLRSISQKELWRLYYNELLEMWKIGNSKPKKLGISSLSRKGRLCLKSTNGHVYTIDKVRGRDECFNSVIGFSDLQWKNLQSLESSLV